MFLNRILGLMVVLAVTQWSGCGSVPVPPPLSAHEQMTVDTLKAKGLLADFERQVTFQKNANVEKYLSTLAQQVARMDEGFQAEKISVRNHQDSRPELKRNFSFPGVVISIPKSVLHAINFENELAAVIALELAHVKRRDLALAMEKNDKPKLFGEESIFKFSQQARAEAIDLGTKLMYAAGYDPRGMVAVFQKFSGYYFDSSTPTGKKEMNFYVKQAQKAKNEFMPSTQPIVRSNDFLRMKKELKE